MVSVEQMLRIDPELSSLSEEELEAIRASIHDSAQLAFEVWWTRKYNGSKYPVGLFPQPKDKR